MKRILLSIFLLIQLTQQGSAQVLPPDFICVEADTLFWNLPTNTCGAFVSYEIFFSSDINGPYSSLATITDQSQTSYFHATAGSNDWYYYMVSNYDCPGEPQITSDTLDSDPPDVSVIEVASVENGQVELTWNPSPSPETIGYIIYRESPIGIIAIDTVFGATTYIDTGALPNNQSESYYVNALDPCGNTSIFDDIHQTIFLEGVVSVCEQSVLLSWNLYQNWLNPIESHRVWVSVNGGQFELVQTIDGDDTSFLFEDANDGDEYCFYIEAIEMNTGVSSKSNIFCQPLDIVQPVRDLAIKNISVVGDNQVEVDYIINSDAEISQIRVLRGGTEISSEPPPVPLMETNNFVDNMVDPSTGSISYQIVTNDECDSVAVSEIAQTIHLTALPTSNNANQITWTPLRIPDAFSISYEIYRIENGAELFLGTALETDSVFLDPVDVNNPNGADACYLVIGLANVECPDGSLAPVRSRSNIGCVAQPVKIFVPNAFAPRGVNREFKPLVVFGENLPYEMIIYNRYGQQVFVSNEIEEGWKGKINGEDAPPGGYLYTITITQEDGKSVKSKGTIILIR